MAANELVVDLWPKQVYALETPATEVLYGGAGGGGKSHLFRVLALHFATEVPGIVIYFLRRQANQLRDNHLIGPTSFPELLRERLQRKEVVWKGSDSNYVFSNGSFICLRHCQYESDVGNIQGPEPHVLIFDELTHFTRHMYTFIRRSLRVTQEFRDQKIPDRLKNKFPCIYAGTNPGGIGHNWVKADFIEGVEPYSIRKMPMEDGGMYRQFIPAKLEDNPSLDLKEYEGKLAGLDKPWLAKAMRHGDWNIIAGGLFDDILSESRHVLGRGIVNQMDPSWPFWGSLDWGMSSPYCQLWYCKTQYPIICEETKIYIPSGSVIVIDEAYGIKIKDGKYVPNVGVGLSPSSVSEKLLMKELSLVKDIGIARLIGEDGTYRTRDVVRYGDPAIFQKNQSRVGSSSLFSVADQFRDSGIYYRPANNARVPGWTLIRKLLGEENRIPYLYISSRCVHLLRTLASLLRDDKNPDDANTQMEDHAPDSLRYGLTNSIVKRDADDENFTVQAALAAQRIRANAQNAGNDFYTAFRDFEGDGKKNGATSRGYKVRGRRFR